MKTITSILKFFRCTYSLNSLGQGETKDFVCSTPVTGRYVYITLMLQEILTLCEVEVYAYGTFYIQISLAINVIHISMQQVYNWKFTIESSLLKDGEGNI